MALKEISLPYHSQTLGTKIAATFDKFANVPVSPTTIANHLRRLAGKNAIINVEKSNDVDHNDINLTAYYDPDEDEDENKPFEVVLILNPKDKQITLDRARWREFASQVIDYLEHEMIHQNQYRSRDFHPGKQYRSKAKDPEIKQSQEYLGNSDEIEAHAYNLSSELLRKTAGDYDRTLRLLRNFSVTAMTKDQAGRLLSPNMFAYFKDFGFNTTHPVLKSLMKKTYQYVLLNKKKQERANKVTKRNSDIEQQEKEFNERKEALDKQLRASYTTIIDR